MLSNLVRIMTQMRRSDPESNHNHWSNLSDQNDLIKLAPEISSIIKKYGLIGNSFVKANVLKAFQSEGISVSYNNYYSIIPDINSLPSSLWNGPVYARAWQDVNVDDYTSLLESVLVHSAELANTPSDNHSGEGFFWDNPMFPPLDAIAYYGIIRELRPNKILEVGSGYSTHLAVKAIERNGHGAISSIEPYPGSHLVSISNRLSHLANCAVQDAPMSMFDTLEAGDILFIDTTHTLKAGSDVNHLLFEVMPRIKSGVYIHIHDFFVPYEYPKEWYDEIGIIWNEQYAIMAFLMNNSKYKVILPNYLASVEHSEPLSLKLGNFDIWNIKANLGGARGASLWIQKI